MTRPIVFAMNIAILLSLVACGGGSSNNGGGGGGGGGGGTNPTRLVSVTVGGIPTTNLAPTQTAPLTATAAYSDNTSQNVTTTSMWSSSNEGIATVAGGVVTARAVGAANITASFQGVSDTKALTVVGASVKADPGGPYDTMHNVPITLSAIRSTSVPFPIASFEWDCGQGQAIGCQGTGPTQTVTYRKCGISGRPACQSGSTTTAIYTVSLTVTDTQGNKNTAMTTIQVRNSY